MLQFAKTISHTPPATAPSVADAIAAITEAGRTIAELRTRLAAAERTVAVLRDEKRALKVALRSGGHIGPRLPATSEANPYRSHLDDALAAVLDGLGPNLVRRAPER